MTSKSYTEVQKSFSLKYLLKSKQKGFSQKELDFFNRTPMDVLARKPLTEQVKVVDYVTKNSVNTCSSTEVKQYYLENIRPTLQFRPTNQADLGNVAYMLTKIADPDLTKEWVSYLASKYAN